MRTKSRPVIEKAPANFEEVRRRFIRQNRELAKNNSSQSLRIRSLELEVSRLLADNLELRNQVLRLQNEVDLAQRRAGGRVKADLREKLEALMGIVDEMDDEDGQSGRTQPKEKKPLEGNWRERQPLTELMRDSQMPTIQEDKQYPRRTLGAEEVQAIRLSDHSSNESPDLGPPPVAHFDYDNAGDPVKNASPLRSKVSLPPETSTGEDEEELPATLSINLETRRKRKDGQPRIEMRRRSMMPPQSPEKEAEQPSTILRTGAKRKLADREAEKPIRPPSKGDFTFSRKTNGEDAKPSSVLDDRSDQSAVGAALPDKPSRKVLGDKSVNMSPQKAKTAPLTEKPENEKPIKPVASRFQPTGKDKDKDRDAISSRRRRTSSIPLPSPPHEEVQVFETVEIPPPPESALPALDIHPKTPAGIDLFSPTPSEPSARPEGGRSGTPPPGDLSTLSTTTDGGARPSRRARSAVNYAEPSLNAKMRRPGKQMVDAISGLQHHSQAMSLSHARESGSRSVIKAEPVEDGDEEAEERWKSLPPAHLSPLSQKSGDAPMVMQPQESGVPLPAASAAPAISSLLANSRKRRESASRPQHTSTSTSGFSDLETAMKKMEDLDIYDFKESSSPLTDSSGVAIAGANTGKAGKTSGTGAARSHRRHSSVPKALESLAGPDALSSNVGRVGEVGVGEEKALKGSVRAASRRRSMML